MNLDPEKTAAVFFSVVAGVALTSAFDRIGAGFMAWLAPALLLLSIRGAAGRKAFLLGLLAGLVHYLSLLYWLVPTMHRYGALPMWLSAGALLLLAFYMALYTGVFAWLLSIAVMRPVFLLPAVPICWVGLEYVKTYLFSGFPWCLLGYSQYRYVGLIQSADLFGVFGISFFVCAAGAALFLILLYFKNLKWQNRAVTRGEALTAIVALAVLFAANAGYGRYRIAQVDRICEHAPQMRISVIQGNIEQSLKWEEAYVQASLDQYIGLSASVLPQNPDLIVWPETALPFYFFYDKQRTAEVKGAAARMKTPLLAGAPACEYETDADTLRLLNSAFLIDSAGAVADRYDKAHLVPFGEYVPLKKWLPFLGKLVVQASDFSSGKPGQLISVNHTDLGVQICYEIIFPHLSAAMVRAGGKVLVNITNDAWFGNTSAPFQHFSMAVFRAVENRRALVRAANTGISGFIHPAGRIQKTSAIFETQTLTHDIALVSEPTSFYTRQPHLLPGTCLAATLLILFAGLRKGLRSRRHCW